MILTTTIFKPKPGKKKSLVSLLKDSNNLFSKEPGCRDSKFYRSQVKPKTFLLLQEWETQEALQEHVSGEIYTAFLDKSKDLLAKAPASKSFKVYPLAEPSAELTLLR